jgi:hypothetical protein
MRQLKSAQNHSHDRKVRDLQVRRIPIEQLIPDPRGARPHSDSQTAAVAASITRRSRE